MERLDVVSAPPFHRSAVHPLWPNPRHLTEDLSLRLIRPSARLIRGSGGTSRTRKWRCVDRLGPSRRTRRLYHDRMGRRRGRRRSRWRAGSDSLLRRTTRRLRGSIRGLRRRRQAGFRRRNRELGRRCGANGGEVARQSIVHRLVSARASRYGKRRRSSDQESWSKRPHELLQQGRLLPVRHRMLTHDPSWHDGGRGRGNDGGALNTRCGFSRRAASIR